MVRKKVCCMLLTVLVGIFILSTTVLATGIDIPDATSQFYVNDFANIIDDSIEQEMQNRAVTFAEESDGIQVVVTTVQTIGDTDAVEYATDMYNQYEIGKNNMGVLIMLSVETRDIQMRIGDNITKYLSDRKCGEIRDEYGIPYFKNDEFEEGLNAMQEATIEYVSSQVESADNEVAVNPTELEDIKSSGSILKIFCIIGLIGCVILVLILLIKYFSNRKKELQEKDEEIKALKSKLNQKIDENEMLEEKNNSLKHELSITQKDFEKLKERYKRALQEYPNLDEKVDAIFAREKEEADKQCAKKAEKFMETVVELECTRANLCHFRNAYEEYKELSKDQQKYIPSELVKKVKKLYSNSSELQRKYEEEQRIKRDKAIAREVEKEILSALTIHVTRHSLNNLRQVCNSYDRLSNAQKRYVNADIDTLKAMKRKAKRMNDDYEEEERRRRDSYYHGGGSSFTGGGFGGSHSGFGGHSSGHGAGGKF